MARGKQTEMAVLGALSVQPMSGYAVREAIRDVLGHFWSESFGQIYPALTSLHREGFIERGEGARPGASTYSLTAAGRDRLLTLLQQPENPAPARNGLMLRLFFGHTIGADACRVLIQHANATARQQLENYHAIRAHIDGDEESAENRPYWLLTVSAGEHSAHAAIAWSEQALVALDDLTASCDVPADRSV